MEEIFPAIDENMMRNLRRYKTRIKIVRIILMVLTVLGILSNINSWIHGGPVTTLIWVTLGVLLNIVCSVVSLKRPFIAFVIAAVNYTAGMVLVAYYMLKFINVNGSGGFYYIISIVPQAIVALVMAFGAISARRHDALQQQMANYNSTEL